MHSIKWRLVAATALVLATTTLACGRDSSAPTDATQQQSSGTTGGQSRGNATGLSVTPGSLVMKVGMVGQLTAALVDGTGAVIEVPTGSLPWTSSATAVVTVNGSGAVTAVGAGEATVSVTTGGFTGSARVIVSP